MKSALKRLVLRLAPGPAGALQTWRQRRHVRRFQERLGLPRITRAFVERHGLQVLEGPFAGMRYVDEAVGSAFVPKLLGSYEAELHPLLTGILHTDYRVIVDIGCAEGYYAVGLARSLSRAKVYAFDVDPVGRQLCEAMARTNHVEERVVIDAKCETRHLNRLLHEKFVTGKLLIVCDCEGCEYDLIDPTVVPGLRQSDVLVELHPGSETSLNQKLLQRFETTHNISLITALERDPAFYPVLQFLSPEQQRLAVQEFRRVGQQWAFLTVKDE